MCWIGTKSRDGRPVGRSLGVQGLDGCGHRGEGVHVSGYVLNVGLTLTDGVGLGESLDDSGFLT